MPSPTKPVPSFASRPPRAGPFYTAFTAPHWPLHAREEGIAPLGWLGSTSLALLSVILVDIWHWVPFVVLILFAAVEALPHEVLEAARMDGATRWQLPRRVTLPLLMPAITVTLGFLAWTLAFHMIPVLTLVGSWYLAFKSLGLYDSKLALILTHVSVNLPMAVWLMMSFFRDIPPEIEQAALVDGCHPLSAFWRVTLPLVVPGLIATGVLAFVFSWNEFSIALNLVSQGNATVPVVVARFAQDYEIQHGQMAAASILATIPAMVLMVFGQRFIVQGLTMGSVK